MPKSGAEALSEDRIVFTNGFAAVVDGCSNRLGLEYEGFSPGFIASKCIELAISRFALDVDVFDALRIMNDTIREWYLEHGLLDIVRQDPRMRISCYFAIFSEYRREVWVLGDCKALVGNNLITSEKNIDKLHESLRSFFLRAEILKGKSEEELYMLQDEIQSFTNCISSNQAFFQNSTDSLFGYSAMDGFYNQFNNLKVYEIPEGIDELVLSSDGYPKLYNNLADSESYLLTQIRQDPLCFKSNLSVKGVCPGFNSYDDRSYLRIKI